MAPDTPPPTEKTLGKDSSVSLPEYQDPEIDTSGASARVR